MKFADVLQIMNVVLLTLFGAAGWRVIDEWRRSREERHSSELALRETRLEACKASIENLKASHQHEMERRDLENSRLEDDNRRLSQKRDERTALLEEQIQFLKAQAPAGVSANFDALRKLYTEQLAAQELQLRGYQSTLADEQTKHESELKSRDSLIELLRADMGSSVTSLPLGIGVQDVLPPQPLSRRQALERDREQVRRLISTAESPSGLISALGHWNCQVRQIAAKALVSRGHDVVPALVDELGGRRVLAELFLWPVGRFVGNYMQRLEASMSVLTTIGDAAVPTLKEMIEDGNDVRKARAVITLQRINSEAAKGVLNQYSNIAKVE